MKKTREEIIALTVAYARNLTDPDFKPFSPKRMEQIGSKNPIHVATKDDVGKIARLVCSKSQTDWLISENGAKHLVTAELEGRIEVGVIVLIANWREAANADHAVVILDKLHNVPTNDGPYGPFWPVNRDFVPGNVASEADEF
jgi:hypothetical protein